MPLGLTAHANYRGSTRTIFWICDEYAICIYFRKSSHYVSVRTAFQITDKRKVQIRAGGLFITLFNH